MCSAERRGCCKATTAITWGHCFAELLLSRNLRLAAPALPLGAPSVRGRRAFRAGALRVASALKPLGAALVPARPVLARAGGLFAVGRVRTDGLCAVPQEAHLRSLVII